jgi:hypothetical protein
MLHMIAIAKNVFARFPSHVDRSPRSRSHTGGMNSLAMGNCHNPARGGLGATFAHKSNL